MASNLSERITATSRAIHYLADQLDVVAVGDEDGRLHRLTHRDGLEVRLALPRVYGQFVLSELDMLRGSAASLLDVLATEMTDCRDRMRGMTLVNIALDRWALPARAELYADEEMLQRIEHAALKLMASVDSIRKGGGPVL